MAEPPVPPPPPAVPSRAAVRGAHLFMTTATIGLGLFAAWAWFSRLDVVSVAVGEVVPASQVKAIQHLEGGIVSEILVREGESVVRDQPLVVLESTTSGADVAEISTRIAALRADVVRLEAEAANQDQITLPEGFRRDHADLADQVLAQFRSRQESYRTNLATQQELVAQRQQAINEIDARLRNSRSTLKLMEEQIKISEELLKDQLTNRLNHLALLREASGLKSRIEEDSAALLRTQAGLKEAQSQLVGIRNTHRQEINDQLTKTHRDLEEMGERQKKFSDNLRRTVLRSPVDGLVKTVYVATRGGVVQAGKTVVDVVPAGDRLVVEAKLPVYDVGYVRAGQMAFVRLASQDASRFGSLHGTVVNVSPDSIVTDKGAYYKVRVETNGDRFRHGREEYQLLPGIQVTANIVTGERSVFDYLTDPLLGRVGEAMRERLSGMLKGESSCCRAWPGWSASPPSRGSSARTAPRPRGGWPLPASPRSSCWRCCC
ncbi:MAG: HlyD family type I secretion periplasmic adaptor subunit [Alphaproteobacteria bacterium]